MFNESFTVKTIAQTITNDENVSYPILAEYGIENQKASSYIKVPVNIEEGPVLIHETRIDNVLIPESIAFAKDGYCEIPFEEEREVNINFHHPLDVEPVVNYEFQAPRPEAPRMNISNLVRTEHLNPEEKRELLTLCTKYKDVFFYEQSDLTFTNAVKHEIRTTDNDPVFCKSFRYPYHLQQEIQNQIQKLLDNRIIRSSVSPYSSPVWIVPKKLDASGRKKWRLVVDYRKLNERTIEDKYPLPRIDEILDNLGKCSYCSTLDLAQGFHQIEMDPESIEKTAFVVNNGHYEYIRMPFGLKNAPSTFQRVMDNVLREYLHKFCFVYMDDVVIFSKSLHQHLAHIRQIFQKLKEYNLKVQLDKSEFLRKEVGFLGHVITPDGIKPNPSKIHAIQNYPLPKAIREIRAFLGLAGYYRRFIHNFARIVQPLTRCLKKGTKIDCDNPDYINAFKHCKELLVNSPIIAYPDFDKTFCLTTDASNVATGGVLSQNSKPIAFYSRSLNSAEKNYSTIEREHLAIVECCKHFRPYIFGREFLIETDHKPLVWLFFLKDPNSRLTRWRLRLEEFQYKIQYKKGKENMVADALSRIEINTKERVSDYDVADLLSVLANADLEDLTPDDCDEILAQNIDNPNEPCFYHAHFRQASQSFCEPCCLKIKQPTQYQAHQTVYETSLPG
ncbi:hypothetical protein Trydic_g8478 [Trypoxylus dichotomus]